LISKGSGFKIQEINKADSPDNSDIHFYKRMNTKEVVPYNGEESDLRDVVEDTNSTLIGVSDVVKHIIKNTELGKEGIPEQVMHSFVYLLLSHGHLRQNVVYFPSSHLRRNGV
jgi:hypothetical protein